MQKIILALAASSFLLACEDVKETGDVGETGIVDTGCYTYTEPDLVGATADNSAGSEWYYALSCDGWCGGGNVTIMQTGSNDPWGPESHDMVQGDYDVCGSYDNWEITLPVVTDYTAQVDGENTLYISADSDRYNSLTFKFTAYDLDGAFLECWVWGNDISYFSADGCEDATNY